MLLNFINEYLNLFIFSFLFNFTIFYIVKSGLLENNLKFKLKIILKSNINLITFISFFLFLLISLYLNIYKLHLDNTETVINENHIKITGSLLMKLLQSLGSAGVFAVSSRMVAGLITKQPFSILTKYGYIVGGGIDTTVFYRLVCNNVPILPTEDVIIKTGPIQVILENSSNNNNLSNLTNSENEQNTSISLLEHCKKFTMNNTQLTENTEKLNNGTSQITINGNTEASSKILTELDKLDPNWKDNFFVKSPLENGDAITKFFIETLTDNLILHFIILYFIVGLTIIIFCKFNLPKDPQFPKIKTLPFGNLIHKLLTHYITVWQISSSFWIYLILFFLFLFNLGSIISMTKLLFYFQSL